MSIIKNFCEATELISCSGQPTEDQLEEIAQQNYQVVINLGLTGTPYALTDEQELIQHLGLKYHHIPVLFEEPQLSDLLSFLNLMENYPDNKVLIHCAANYRASVYTGYICWQKVK